MHHRSPVGRGLAAGAVAATAIAVWFLAFDVLRGEALRTPLFLAATLIKLDLASRAAAVALYTVIHYAGIMAIGVVAAMGLDWLRIRPGPLIGAILGFLLFDIVFYAGLVLAGTTVLRALGWPVVLAGCLFGGLAMAGTLTLFSGVADEPAVRSERTRRVATEAVVSGLLAAVGVALWFLVLDLVQGRPLFTPAAIGSALLYGAQGTESVVIDANTVLLYSFVHFAAFGLVGITAAALVNAAEDQPPLILGIFLLFVTFEALFIGILAIAAGWLMGALQWWAVAAANVIAAALVGGYLARRHPGIRRRLDENVEAQVA
ncbi:MAG TPA: hypothetical protein VK936_11415 [Longimicrobiales bacterium]|nr:hypothetical protein [Longimicrobiales bacterium]